MSFKIELTQGKSAVADDAFRDISLQHSWHYVQGYAATKISRKRVFMHRMILKPDDGFFVDHINHDRLDNRRSNLRMCTQRQNSRNNTRSDGKSKFRGVSWWKKNQKWVAQLKVLGKRVRFKYCDNEIHAAKLYDKWAREFYGEFANTNFKS